MEAFNFQVPNRLVNLPRGGAVQSGPAGGRPGERRPA
jgi:hypothetical protein